MSATMMMIAFHEHFFSILRFSSRGASRLRYSAARLRGHFLLALPYFSLHADAQIISRAMTRAARMPPEDRIYFP